MSGKDEDPVRRPSDGAVPVSITLGPRVGDATIVVGGQDISGAVRAFRVNASVREMPTLTLELGMHVGPVDGDMRLLLAPHSVAMLTAFGWLSPEHAERQRDGSVLLRMPERCTCEPEAWDPHCSTHGDMKG